ncbi:MAG TPA: hypothetical protein VGK34_10495, partial [Armatimonadota bacterium]
MSEQMPSPEHEEPERMIEPVHTPRAWRNCCLLPYLVLMLAIAVVGITGLTKYLRKGITIGPRAYEARVQTFGKFANDYFAIAEIADAESKHAFQVLRDARKKTASVADMQEAFRKAAEANGVASGKFAKLSIPESLMSQAKLKRSITTMSLAYKTRQAACTTLAVWNGNLEDIHTQETYMEESD